MIRVVFNNERPASWAHEMLGNRRVLDVLRAHGVPVAGRLVFSGIARGKLVFVQEDSNMTFDYIAPGENTSAATRWKQTHNDGVVLVFMSGEHLANHEAQAEDEDLF